MTEPKPDPLKQYKQNVIDGLQRLLDAVKGAKKPKIRLWKPKRKRS